MPTYEYRCPNGHDFEKFFRSISSAEAEPAISCPVCGLIAVRQLSSSAGLMFKGSGFYLTDYGKNAHGKKAPPAAASADGSSAGSSESVGGESSSGADSSGAGGESKNAGAQSGAGSDNAAKSDRPAKVSESKSPPNSPKQKDTSTKPSSGKPSE